MRGAGSKAGPDGPAQPEYVSCAGSGHVVGLVTGRGGPFRYQDVAQNAVELDYYTVLLDERDILDADRKSGVRFVGMAGAGNAFFSGWGRRSDVDDETVHEGDQFGLSLCACLAQ